jgi:hypothetical protein
MKPEEQYQSWKKHRATVEVPDGFAEQVMASVHQTRRLTSYLLLQTLLATVGRSRFARASVCSVALGIWLVRIGVLLTIFVPR